MTKLTITFSDYLIHDEFQGSVEDELLEELGLEYKWTDSNTLEVEVEDETSFIEELDGLLDYPEETPYTINRGA